MPSPADGQRPAAESGAGAPARLARPWWRGLLDDVRHWAKASRLGRDFWVFVLASCVSSFGIVIFLLLYSLYLLDLGFDDKFLGLMTTATTLGSIAGTLPAGLLIARLGPKTTVLGCVAGTAVVYAVQAVVVGQAALLAFAFLSGAIGAVWAVSIAVVVSHLTTVETRAHGFSLFFAASIGTGVLADAIGGELPGWLTPLASPTDPTHGKQAALLLAAALAALAIWPAARLGISGDAGAERTSYPRGPFVVRFLIPLVVWNLAIGTINPFTGAYLAQYLKMSVRHIGVDLAGSELAQAVGLLLVPVMLRRLGPVPSIVRMQLLAGLALGTLAIWPSVLAAGLSLAGYMAFQSMTGPGLNTILMNRVTAAERSGAAALLSLATFSAQAGASAVAGDALKRFGYPLVLTVAAVIAAGAALLSKVVLQRVVRPLDVPPA